MKKYSQIKEKVQTVNRIYLVDIDKTIFWVTLISFFWILVYKLILINIDPLFIDLNNISANSAEITFSIFSSIIAAGIFYFVTIFIPRIFAVKKMKMYFISYLEGNFRVLDFMLNEISNGETGKNYSLKEFIINRKIDNYLVNDLHKFCEKKVDEKFISGLIELEINSLIRNLNHYISLLPIDFIRDTIESWESRYLKLINKDENYPVNKALILEYISLLNFIININYKIKSYLNIKDETIQWICK